MADDAPRRWPLVVVTVAVVLAGVLTGLHFLPDLYATDDRAPDFTLETVEHGTFILSEHRGEVVVLDLMAVDCPTCRVTEKAMLELNRQRPDVTIVSIDIWTQLEDEEYLAQHMQRLNASWPYGMDTDDLFFKYDAYEISKVVVIDPDGFQTWSAVGGIRFAPVLEAVESAEAGGAARERSLGLGIMGFAVFAGVASFFAPCAFPLLPGYMAYSLSLKGDGALAPRTRDALLPGVTAAAGIFVVYGSLGVLVWAFGGVASSVMLYLQPAIGVLAIVLGVALLLGMTMERVVAPLQRGVDNITRRITGGGGQGTLAGYFAYGLGYGAAAAGCVAPVFLQLTLTALALGAVTGLRIFLIFAGVSALLMIVATIIAVHARGWLQQRAAVVSRVVNRASGVILVGAGIYLLWFFQRGAGLGL